MDADQDRGGSDDFELLAETHCHYLGTALRVFFGTALRVTDCLFLEINCSQPILVFQRIGYCVSDVLQSFWEVVPSSFLGGGTEKDGDVTTGG